ncbi:MAG: ABC transporter substrate-binding protein [Thermaerobacter sp.]|nr:ABC transporter substrate-binding protein [Thermaerobacter sp.]
MNKKLANSRLLSKTVGIVACLALAGCGTARTVSSATTTNQNSPHPIGGTLSTIGGPHGTWVDENNPYSPTANINPAAGLIYEPLVQWNSANGQYKPWLATSWSWNSSNTVLTINLHHGVKWSNGTPFTSKDVAFTFQMMKKYPSTDFNGVWSYLASVTTDGTYGVKLTLKQPSSMFFYYLSQTPIVPQAIWSKQNPVTWADPHPVGTGPYILQSFTPESITMVRNPHYWQAPKPYLGKVVFPAESSNTSTVLALAQNQIQWSGTFSFNLQRSYVDRAPQYNHVGLYPNGLNILWVNLHAYPLNMLVVRQAISMTINRSAMARISWSGYSPAVTNLTGVTPGMASIWSTPALAAQYPATYNPTAAKQMLLKAGFKMGSNGVLITPRGTPFDITIDVPTPFSDDVAASQLISQELKQIGINVTLQDNSRNAYYSKLQLGQFDIAVSWSPWGANPFFTLYPAMSQTYTAPYGHYAVENFGRYNNPEVQTLGQQFLSTYSQAQQVPVVLKLQQIFASQLPIIPLTYRNTPIEYSTQNIGGWPTKANPYWNLNEGNLPVLINLYKK